MLLYTSYTFIKNEVIRMENINWSKFLQPYELAVEGFILKIEGIKKQYELRGEYCPIEIVTGRVKSPDSILDKANRLQALPSQIALKVYDIGGVRITCKYIDDVYSVCELLKNRKDIKLLEERDYIKNVKPSGYRSLHLIVGYNVETIDGQVPVILEFQIRTHAMHFWASIEHSLKYKYQKMIPEDLKIRLKSASQAAAKLDEEMSEIHRLMNKLEGKPIADPLENEISLVDLKKW